MIRHSELTRREALRAVAGGVLCSMARAAFTFHFATFTRDITPPLGHPLLDGPYGPALKIGDPLYAKGFVLLGAGEPLAFVVVDFCEIRSVAFECWQTAIGEAAGTDPSRVLLSSGQMHNAPLADTVADTILEDYGIKGEICDPAYRKRCVRRTAEDIRQAVRVPRKVAHFGFGHARVDRVVSNRRAVRLDDTATFARFSTTHDPVIRNAPGGLVYPYLKSLSFFYDGRPLTALS